VLFFHGDENDSFEAFHYLSDDVNADLVSETFVKNYNIECLNNESTDQIRNEIGIPSIPV